MLCVSPSLSFPLLSSDNSTSLGVDTDGNKGDALDQAGADPNFQPQPQPQSQSQSQHLCPYPYPLTMQQSLTSTQTESFPSPQFLSGEAEVFWDPNDPTPIQPSFDEIAPWSDQTLHLFLITMEGRCGYRVRRKKLRRGGGVGGKELRPIKGQVNGSPRILGELSRAPVHRPLGVGSRGFSVSKDHRKRLFRLEVVVSDERRPMSLIEGGHDP